VSPTSGAKGAVTRQQFERRFETSAALPLAGRADRFAAFDIAWPRDAEEAKRLGGNTVIVLGALSQNASELPLARVYLERPGGSPVPCAASVASSGLWERRRKPPKCSVLT
jgi:hypothetical protein